MPAFAGVVTSASGIDGETISKNQSGDSSERPKTESSCDSLLSDVVGGIPQEKSPLFGLKEEPQIRSGVKKKIDRPHDL